MSRSKWKGLYISKYLSKTKKSYPFLIWSRRSTIPFSLVGETVSIYNGKDFKKVFINREKVGFKFGEFSMTRKFNKKDNKNKK